MTLRRLHLIVWFVLTVLLAAASPARRAWAQAQAPEETAVEPAEGEEAVDAEEPSLDDENEDDEGPQTELA